MYLNSILMASYDRLCGFENECEEANIVLKIIDSGVWQHCVRIKSLRLLKLKRVCMGKLYLFELKEGIEGNKSDNEGLIWRWF